MVTRRKQPTLDSHHAADDNNVSFLSPLHIGEDFLHQPHQPKEVGVHHRLHLFHRLTLDGSDQTHPSVADWESTESREDAADSRLTRQGRTGTD